MNYLFDLFGTLIKDQGEDYTRVLIGPFERDRRFYRGRIREYISTTDFRSEEDGLNSLSGHLGIPLSENAKKKFFSDLSEYKRSQVFFQDTTHTLRKLRDNGSKIGILSNASVFVEDAITRFELDRYVDFVVMSHKVRYMKPSEMIYRIALERMGSDAKDVTMVGDQLEKDVLSPITMRMQGVLFDPYNRNGNYRGRRIQQLGELLG